MNKPIKNDEEEFDTEIAGAKEAKEVGKEVGVTEDEAPDFEIVEEEDEKPSTKKSATDDDDRIIKDKPGIHRQTAKEKREAKKKLYRKHGFQEGFTAAEQAYKPIIDSLIKKQSEVDTRLTGVNKAEIERAYAETQRNAQLAEQEYIKAVNASDGARAMHTLRVLSDAKDRLGQLKTVYGNMQATQGVESGKQNEWEPEVVNYANDWKRRNNWFDASGADEDSFLTNKIAESLVKEGYNPKSEKYWEELDTRLEKRNIAVARPDPDDEADEEEEEYQPHVRKRSAPPVSGSANGRGDVKGRQRVSVPTRVIEQWKKQAPDVWDDPKRRNRLIANYLKERQAIESGN